MSAPAPPVGPRPTVPFVRLGPVTVLWRPRMAATCLLAALGVLVLVCVNVGIGELARPPWEVARVLLGGGDRVDRLVVVDLRLPRTLVAVAAGAALGMSGALVQSVTRNPLASPDILGVTTGASAGAVLVIVAGSAAPAASATVPIVGVPGAAVLGGLLAGVAIFVLAWRRGLDGYRVVLVGIGVNAALGSVVSLLLVRAQFDDAARATVWLTGSLEGRGWDEVWPVTLTLLLVGGASLVGARTLGLLRLDDDTATALGLRLGRSRVGLVLAAVLLASVAASAVGPVAFVAFVAPQLARRTLGTAGEPLVGSALAGAVLLLAADVVARGVLPVGLPVGILTATVGAPYFLYLLLRRRGIRS